MSGRTLSAQIWSFIKSFKRNKHKVSSNDLKFQQSSYDAIFKLCPPSCFHNFIKSIEVMGGRPESKHFFPAQWAFHPWRSYKSLILIFCPLLLDLTKLITPSFSIYPLNRLSPGNFQWYLCSRLSFLTPLSSFLNLVSHQLDLFH